MKKWLLIAGISWALVITGCDFITPKTANWIDDNLGNAQAISAKAQDDAALPPYAKQWFAAEAKCWQDMSDIAHRRHPTTQPVK